MDHCNTDKDNDKDHAGVDIIDATINNIDETEEDDAVLKAIGADQEQSRLHELTKRDESAHHMVSWMIIIMMTTIWKNLMIS